MPVSHKILLTINAFSIGVLVPVMTLMFCRHGASLETLWVIMGTFSITVIVLEIPSGITADLIGRKKVFILSHILLLISFLLILISNSLPLLACAAVFLGTGRAFSSGSIEAFEVERFIEKNGSDNLSTINNILTIIESAGTSLGALAGGYLGYADHTYRATLLLLILLEAVFICLTTFVVHEIHTKINPALEHSNLLPSGAHQLGTKPRSAQGNNLLIKIYNALRTRLWSPNALTSVATEMKNSPCVLMIMFMTLALGISLSTVEAYWQPTLTQYLPSKTNWILGLVSCLAYLGVGLGSAIAKYCFRLLKGEAKNIRKFYYLSRILMPVSLMPIFICRDWKIFILIYTAIYIILGMGNLIENTLLHSSIQNTHRASILSCISLFMKAGAIVTSLLGILLLKGMKADMMWVLPPFIALVFVTIIIVRMKKQAEV